MDDCRVAARVPARVEWPTVCLIVAVTAAWAALTASAAAIGLWLAVPAVAILVAFHSSLQHEVLHGHPTRWQWLNDALVFPALGLVVPYQRFRDSHLAHHYDPLLTDPYDDPETNYLDPVAWARPVAAGAGGPRGEQHPARADGDRAAPRHLGAVARRPPRGAGGDRSVARAWALHGARPRAGRRLAGARRDDAGSGPIALGCWGGLAILKIRTFLEHQAHERAAARSVVIEDRGPLALLFLNNNFHAVHHAHPRLPWYRLPGEYARRRDEFLRRNGGYRYRSYGEVFRAPPPPPQGPGRPPDLDAAGGGGGGPRAVRANGRRRRPADVRLARGHRRDRRALGGDSRPPARGGRRGARGARPDRGLAGLDRPRARPRPDLRAAARRTLAGRVAVVGALDYGLPGCRPGWYRSAVIVRADDPRADLADFRGATLAVNGTDSQSGWGAMLHHAAPLATDGRFFGAVRATGAHRASVRAVAAGRGRPRRDRRGEPRAGAAVRADRAAAAGALRDRPDAGAAADRGEGRPTVAPHRRAVAAAVAGLDPATRAALGIRGFVALGAEAWAIVGQRLAAAGARLRDAPDAGR